VTTVDALWAAWDGCGLEHLRLAVDADSVRADSLIIAVADDGRPFRARYLVECDGRWRLRRAHLELIGEQPRSLDLRADDGRWTDGATGTILPLDGCLDIDIYPSPLRCESARFEGLVTRMVTQPDCRGISSRRSRADPTAGIEPVYE
jgi:hypothetical protein